MVNTGLHSRFWAPSWLLAVRGCAPRHARNWQQRAVAIFTVPAPAVARRANLRAPVLDEATAFAPATIANLGPGFDWLGCAVEGAGDNVTAVAMPDRPGEVVIGGIQGDDGRLTLDATQNCAGIAAMEVLQMLGPTTCGIALYITKGLPLGSGLGSSAASAAAGAWAVNLLFGEPFTREELVPAGLVAEAAVSGLHADNIAPALMGSFVLIRGMEPLQMQHIPILPEAAGQMHFVLVTPEFEAPTAEMRAALPASVPFETAVHNSGRAGLLVAGILTGDVEMLGDALNGDELVEPVRGPLIPGFHQVKQAALKAGAFGCTISGAGPTAVAVVDTTKRGARVAAAMEAAFRSAGLEIQATRVVPIDTTGADAVVYQEEAHDPTMDPDFEFQDEMEEEDDTDSQDAIRAQEEMYDDGIDEAIELEDSDAAYYSSGAGPVQEAEFRQAGEAAQEQDPVAASGVPAPEPDVL